MINYSIALRAVNTNQLEINQAKSRIAQAKGAGLAPDPADVTLAKHISEHGCVYSRADISAILYMAVDCMREQLLDGKKIRLGDLGDFSVSLVSKGADSADKFNSGSHITGINVVWECGQEFKNLIADAEFNLVASRAAQAAVLKAVKAGETVVDLSKPTGNDDDPDGGGSGSNGSNGSNQTPNHNGQYTISVTSANTAQGTVTGGGTYTSGSRIQIVATPKSGYAFDKWSDGNTSATRQITVSQNLNLTASFKVFEQGGGTDQTGGTGDDDNQSSVPEF